MTRAQTVHEQLQALAPTRERLTETYKETRLGVLVGIIDEALANTIKYLGDEIAGLLPDDLKGQFLDFFKNHFGVLLTADNISGVVQELGPSTLELLGVFKEKLASGDLP